MNALMGLDMPIWAALVLGGAGAVLGEIGDLSFTIIKRQTGINASDYIHLVRMNKAKELMRDMNLSLTQISKSIGYISDTTFIRSFKKYEGITPGTYRRNFVEPSAPGK